MFYPGDWLSERTLRIASLGARGAWIDLLMLMYKDDTDRITGTILDFSRILGCSYDEAKAAITELIEKEVCDTVGEVDTVTCHAQNRDITLVSRRLERENTQEHKRREADRLRQARKREHDKASQGSHAPSSCSSSSSSSSSPSNAQDQEGAQSSTPPLAACPYEDIKEAWNNIAAKAGCKKCISISAARKRQLNTRWRDKDWRDNWLEAINLLPRQGFALGLTGRGDWRMDFEKFIEPDTVIQILEGHYEGKAAPKSDEASLPRSPGIGPEPV